MARKMSPQSKKKKILMKNQLKNDTVVALKSHDSSRVEVLRYLISLIDKKELQLPPGGMSEADELAVLQKELKNKEESRELFLKGGRQDLVDQLDYEIKVLKEYLPAEVDEAEVVAKIVAARTELGDNFGLIMKKVLAEFAGAVTGDRASAIVRKVLSEGK